VGGWVFWCVLGFLLGVGFCGFWFVGSLGGFLVLASDEKERRPRTASPPVVANSSVCFFPLPGSLSQYRPSPGTVPFQLSIFQQFLPSYILPKYEVTPLTPPLPSRHTLRPLSSLFHNKTSFFSEPQAPVGFCGNRFTSSGSPCWTLVSYKKGFQWTESLIYSFFLDSVTVPTELKCFPPLKLPGYVSPRCLNLKPLAHLPRTCPSKVEFSSPSTTLHASLTMISNFR